MLDKRRRGIYILPNLFTTAALFAGFYAIVQAAREQGALLTVSDAADCWQQAALLLHDEARLRCMGQAGQAFAAGFGGASERIADWLVAALP